MDLTESMAENSQSPNLESMAENSQSPNLKSMVDLAEESDNFFIGCEGKLLHWSARQKKVTKDYGCIMAGYNFSMAQTSDKNYLFLSDNKGC
jgi:hypothetical protein